MLVSQDETLVVSSVGSVDHGGLLVWNAMDDLSRSVVPDDEAQFLLLDAGTNDFFATTHSHRGSYFVTARHIAQPEQVLARIDVSGASASVTGDAQVWARAAVPHR